VSTNNDAPQTFGHDESGDAVFDLVWPGGAEDASRPREVQDRVDGARGWGDRAEPAARGDGPPPLYPGYAQVTAYPQGPGYAPVPVDYLSPDEPGYAPVLGYAQEPQFPRESWPGGGPGWEQDLAFPGHAGPPPDAGSGRGQGYPRDSGYPWDAGGPWEARYADAVPPLEFLPDPGPPWTEPPPDHRGGQGRWQGPAPAGPQPDTRPRPVIPDAAPGMVPAQRSAPDLEYAQPTSDGLSADALLRGRRTAPGGWRRGVQRAAGLLRLGESAAEMRRRDLINRVRTPVAGGHHRVAVLSLKGGVGKTTTAVGLGATFATLRGDRVIAVDANPDRGTLSDKVRLETAATIRDLLNERGQLRRYADVRAFTSQAPSRLEVLASDRDPGVSVAFGAGDYCDVARVLEHFYSICLTDCGTGLLHSAMSGVLHLADQIVVVSSPSVDGARSASATLDWLEAHNYGDLVRNGVVVLSAIRPKSKSTVDLDRLEHHFAARCRAVVRIPYDPHLEEGAEVELELLLGETADAYLTLGAIVGDGLAWPRRLSYRSALP
jgi:MinD-like ATPase involved in chromosome partitioning or flagellar assembly